MDLPAALTHLVGSWYRNYMGRKPGTSEVLGWVAQMQFVIGQSKNPQQAEETVLSMFLSDPGHQEFFKRAQTLFDFGTPE